MTLLNKTSKKYDVINAHAHIYPDKIAERASQSISRFYGIEMSHNGSVSGLLEDGKSAGISRFLVHSVATTPEQVHRINCFLLDEISKHPSFIGFITLHPDMSFQEIKSEVEFGLANGFKGVKLHPDFQTFFPDGARAEKIYVALDGRLPILFHAGDKRYGYSKPERLAMVAKAHPKQDLICAHFGGYSEWNDIGVYKGLDNVYFDTCSSLFALEKEKAVSIIREFGADRFFFGTDYPMWDGAEEMQRFLALDLTEEEREMIFSKNLQRFLKLNK